MEVINLVKHTSKEAEQVLQEIQKWVSMCTKNMEDVSSFGAVIVSKDGSVDTYHEILYAKHNLSLVGGLEALKNQIINKRFGFHE